MDMQNYTTPFAIDGDREEFSIDTDPSGKVSLKKGWTELYQLRPEEGGLFILRKVFNQMMKLVSTDTVMWKTQSFPNWIDDKGDGLPFAYPKNAIVKHTNGNTYVSLINNNTQIPTGSNWKLFDITSLDNTVKLTENQTIAGVKTFSVNPISTAVQSTAVNALTRKDYVDGLDSANVKLTGNQTIAGVKTFSSNPIVPTPTQNTQSANKQYVDDYAMNRVAKRLTEENLNDLTLGYYVQPSNVNVTPERNYPTNLAGTLTVYGENQKVQEYTLYNDNTKYIRTFYLGTWTAWERFVTEKELSFRIGLIDYGYVAKSYHIVAFGGEFNRADYPKLWAYLQANPSLVKTQAQWTTENTTNGMCGFFSDGNGTTTFRVPNLDKAFLRPDSRTVASYQGDAIRNITGTFSTRKNIAEEPPTGVFTGVSSGNGALNNLTGQTVTFDASKVVPTANENRPKNIAVLPLIVAK